MPVNTAKVVGRRKLDYASLEEVLADTDRLSSGPVPGLGNWSAGQIFRHLALAYNGSIDGLKVTFPWHLCIMAKFFKNKLINGPMPAGLDPPPEGKIALAPGVPSTQEGVADLRAATARLNSEPHRAPHPLFGELSKEQWNQIHLRHAGLHMSFLVPG